MAKKLFALISDDFLIMFGTHHRISQMPVVGTGAAASNNKEEAH